MQLGNNNFEQMYNSFTDDNQFVKDYNLGYNNGSLPGQQAMYVKMAAFVEQPASQPLFIRPYQSQLTSHSLQRFYDATEEARFLSPLKLSTITKEIMFPSTTCSMQASVSGGFNIKRYSFFLIIYIGDIQSIERFRNTGQGNITIEMFTGYTEHYDIFSMFGAIDENAIIHITNRTLLSEQVSIGAFGKNASVDVLSNTGFIPPINNVYQNSSMYGNSSSQYLMTPANVVDELERRNFVQNHKFEQNTEFFNADTEIVGVLSPISPQQENAVNYLSNILTSYTKNVARNDTGRIGNMYGAYEVFGAIKDNLKQDESSLVRSQFLNKMRSANQLINLDYTFRLGDFFNLFPESKINKLVIPNTNNDLIPNNYTEHWEGSDINSIISYSIATSFANLMLEEGIGYINMIMTNAGDFRFVSQYKDTVQSGGSLRQHIYSYQENPYVTTTVMMTVLPFLSEIFLVDQQIVNKRLDNTAFRFGMYIYEAFIKERCTFYNLQINATLHGTIQITLELDGGIPITRQAPLYCSNNYSAMQTFNINNLHDLTDTIQQLTEVTVNENMPAQNQAGGFSTPFFRG